ncbi:hypothetical protein [Streptomyces sp. TLI_146]|uniref:hypothetical protein n=1 Tax=Streptomyces sp. TLI_146 TaxID=1938858 RepID=UPI000C714C99|nr:hypothetical protein [Streptomyces sp. TLI_146]PKV82899.1 hypothetical protein BX283_0366 [Streptomyces sp. TLI_146]
MPVNAPYVYTVTVPTQPDWFYGLSAALSGSAATFTAVTSSDPEGFCTISSGTQVNCYATHPGITSDTVTLTVLPTAPGTVTAAAHVDSDTYTGDDSTTTTITPAGPT